MATAIVRKPISFRLREDVIARLKQRAALANYSLNNYVESVLLDDVYDEPNEVTKAAIEEAKKRKDYPENELYSSAEELMNALNAELDTE